MSGIEIAAIVLASYATYQSGQSAQQQAKAQAKWHAYNAKVAEQEAEAERQASAFEAKQPRRRGAQLLARQRTLIGASGIEMEGSPLLVAEDTAAQLAKENINIRLQGLRRVSQFKSQSILDISKASASKSQASSYGQAAYIGAGSSILSGIAGAQYRADMKNLPYTSSDVALAKKHGIM